MRSLKSSGLTALFASLAVVAASFPLGGLSSGLLGLAPSVAPAGVTTVASGPVSAGKITLSTSKDKGVVTWGDVKQEFGNSPLGNCVLTPKAGTKSLLDLMGYNGKISSSAGFKKGFIGVYNFSTQGGPPSNAAHCEQVDDGGKPKPSNEMLGVHLGPDAKDTFGPLVATEATLQLVANSKPGSAQAILLDAEGDHLSTQTFSWSKSGDFTLTVNGQFSGVLLKVTKGSFSLKGATFDVASQADDFFCDGSDDTYTNENGVTVTFLGNADGSDCEGFGIKLGRDGDAQVHFIKPLDVNPMAQFVFEVPWGTVPLTSEDALLPGSSLPPAYIDFELPPPNEPTEHEMPYCPDYLFDETGDLVGMAGASEADWSDLQGRDMEEDEAGVPQTTGIQFACIGDRSAEVNHSGSGLEATITDLIYLIGDARMLMR